MRHMLADVDQALGDLAVDAKAEVHFGAGTHRAGIGEFAAVLRLADLDHLDRADDVLDFGLFLAAGGEPERGDDQAGDRQPADDGTGQRHFRTPELEMNCRHRRPAGGGYFFKALIA